MYNIAIVGATGNVGRMFLNILEERNFPIHSLYLFASKKSAGTYLNFKNKKYIVEETTENNIQNKKIDYALFSAGGEASLNFAPIFNRYGAIVIDNSNTWRMNSDVPLVVPEVNPEDLKNHKGIIANPNCSTIQAMIPLKILKDNYGIKRIIYSTYQAVSGAGIEGINDLKNGVVGALPTKFPYQIFNNCIPQIDVFLDNGYTKEESKMINETKKILHDDNLKITATTVRVPVLNCHSESINIELLNSYTLDDVINLFNNTEGLTVYDEKDSLKYPMPILVDGQDNVTLYSILEDPMTSCGCFECICGIMPEANGFVIVNREFAQITPVGMTFGELASMTGGGVQTPGFMGHGRHFISSKKFAYAEGGPERIVWMPKELKDYVADKLNATVKEMCGIENFTDMICDETIASDSEGVLAFLEEKGHPALSMECVM